MKLNSHNEWDPLREVIVGTVDRMTVGLEFPSPRPVTTELFARAADIAKQAVPDWYRDEVNQDLEGLCGILRGLGAEVLRPTPYDSASLYGTPDWHASGKDLCNVRDLQLVIGDRVIACPSPAKCSYHETDAFRGIWYRYLGEQPRTERARRRRSRSAQRGGSRPAPSGATMRPG